MRKQKCLLDESNYNIIEKIYMNRIHDKIIKSCKENDIILDFGCGRGYLKKRNPNFKIINYDIVKELSEVEDYTKKKPTIIICSHVLEHLISDEIRKHLRNFKKMKPRLLIVAIPTGNIISRMGEILISKNLHLGHITKLNQINKILKEEKFCLLKKRRIFTLTELTVWKVNEK